MHIYTFHHGTTTNRKKTSTVRTYVAQDSPKDKMGSNKRGEFIYFKTTLAIHKFSLTYTHAHTHLRPLDNLPHSCTLPVYEQKPN